MLHRSTADAQFESKGLGAKRAMSDLASLREAPPLWAEPEAAPEAAPLPWLPPEAPLVMPRQQLDPLDAPYDASQQTLAPATSPRRIAQRRYAVFGGAAALTALVAIGPWILYGRAGFDALEALGFGVFLVLASAIASS